MNHKEKLLETYENSFTVNDVKDIRTYPYNGIDIVQKYNKINR